MRFRTAMPWSGFGPAWISRDFRPASPVSVMGPARLERLLWALAFMATAFSCRSAESGAGARSPESSDALQPPVPTPDATLQNSAKGRTHLDESEKEAGSVAPRGIDAELKLAGGEAGEPILITFYPDLNYAVIRREGVYRNLYPRNPAESQSGAPNRLVLTDLPADLHGIEPYVEVSVSRPGGERFDFELLKWNSVASPVQAATSGGGSADNRRYVYREVRPGDGFSDEIIMSDRLEAKEYRLFRNKTVAVDICKCLLFTDAHPAQSLAEAGIIVKSRDGDDDRFSVMKFQPKL